MNKNLALLFILFIASAAKAGFLFEPYVGIESGLQSATIATSVPVVGGQSADATVSSAGFGTRLGWLTNSSFWLAADASINSSGKTTYKSSISSSTTGPDFTRISVGLSLGYDWTSFRIWAGYIASDSMVHKTTVTNTYKGTGYKVGVGVKINRLLSLNLEYAIRKFTEASGDSFTNGTKLSDLYSKLEHSTALISISIPYEI